MNVGERVSFIALIGVIIICFINVFILTKKLDNNNKTITELNAKINQYESIDVPSKGELDSLKTNISYKDSIIKQIKTEYIKDVEWVKNMPDSAAVALFNQLVWANNNTD